MSYTVYSLYIINKSGGLIYTKDFAEVSKIDLNDTLRLASICIYEIYTDYVLKNPFYEVEQVIKCELFDENIEGLVRRYPVLT